MNFFGAQLLLWLVGGANLTTWYYQINSNISERRLRRRRRRSKLSKKFALSSLLIDCPRATLERAKNSVWRHHLTCTQLFAFFSLIPLVWQFVQFARLLSALAATWPIAISQVCLSAQFSRNWVNSSRSRALKRPRRPQEFDAAAREISRRVDFFFVSSLLHTHTQKFCRASHKFDCDKILSERETSLDKFSTSSLSRTRARARSLCFFNWSTHTGKWRV